MLYCVSKTGIVAGFLIFFYFRRRKYKGMIRIILPDIPDFSEYPLPHEQTVFDFEEI